MICEESFVEFKRSDAAPGESGLAIGQIVMVDKNAKNFTCRLYKAPADILSEAELLCRSQHELIKTSDVAKDFLTTILRPVTVLSDLSTWFDFVRKERPPLDQLPYFYR